jgi:hypothetical protein
MLTIYIKRKPGEAGYNFKTTYSYRNIFEDSKIRELILQNCFFKERQVIGAYLFGKPIKIDNKIYSYQKKNN